MIQLELSPEEARVLSELLDSAFGDLRQEVSKTDDHDFKEELKRREATLQGLRKKVQPPA